MHALLSFEPIMWITLLKSYLRLSQTAESTVSHIFAQNLGNFPKSLFFITKIHCWNNIFVYTQLKKIKHHESLLLKDTVYNFQMKTEPKKPFIDRDLHNRTAETSKK